MPSPIEQIKEKLDIRDVIGSYIELKQYGTNFKAKCPFHNEKTPSFFVSPERKNFYCFGCGAKGDIFTFVEKFEGIDFPGALKLLAERAGVTIGAHADPESKARERIYETLEAATRFFESCLVKNQKALEYLKGRGVREDSIKAFRLGFAPASWQDARTHLAKAGFSDEELEIAGLVKKSDKPGMTRYYDRFRSRIMFPMADSSGRIVAFSGRLFEDGFSSDAEQPKYLNSPESPVFDKSSTLYGIDRAKTSIRKHNFSILVEGQMDLVLSHQHGFTNTIATSGTALAEKTESASGVRTNLGFVRALSSNIILAYDRDGAGIKASARAATIALSIGMDVKIASLPEGMDPADVLSKEGSDAWKQILVDARHVIEFELEAILASGIPERQKGKEIRERVLPYLLALSTQMDRAHFIRKIADASGIREEAVWDDVKTLARQGNREAPLPETPRAESSRMSRLEELENKVLALLSWQRSAAAPVLPCEKAEAALKELLGEDRFALIEERVRLMPEAILASELMFDTNELLVRGFDELVLNLEEEMLRQEKDRLSLAVSKGGGDDVLAAYQSVSMKLARVQERRARTSE